MNELLKKFNLKYEDLTSEEIATLDKWQQSLASRSITLPDIKDYINTMIEVLERELHGYDTPKTFTSFLFRGRRNRNLEARLMNYLMLRDFVTAPEKARVFVEKQLSQLSPKK